MNLTGVILSRNNERTIEASIKNLSFCDEVIVIDDESSDDTAKLAKAVGAKVIVRGLGNDFSAQRNFVLTKALGKWVFFLDSDEEVDTILTGEIVKATIDPTNPNFGYFVKRSDFFLGKRMGYGEVGSDYVVRLGRKFGGSWKRAVHETWEVGGRTSTLKGSLIHNSHTSLFNFFKGLNYYSSLHAKANRQEGKRSSMPKIIFYPILKFIDNYIFKLGLLDGAHGLLNAFGMSTHSFLSWSKLWMNQKQEL